MSYHNDAKKVFTQCIMFESSFRSPKKAMGRGMLMKNTHGLGG